jgi:hypothetical protein
MSDILLNLRSELLYYAEAARIIFLVSFLAAPAIIIVLILTIFDDALDHPTERRY